MQPTVSGRYIWWGMVAVLLSAVVVYSFAMTRTLQYDEAFTYLNFARTPFHALLVYTFPNNHLLQTFFVWLTTTLGGNSEIAIRFPAFAAALLTLAYTYRVGRRIHSPVAGYAGALLLATTFIFADYAVNARGYTLSMLLTLILLEQVALNRNELTRRRRYGLSLLSAALMMTLPSMALALAAAMLWILIEAARKQLSWSDAGKMLSAIIFGSIFGALFYTYGVMTGVFTEGLPGYSTLDALIKDLAIMFFNAGLAGGLLALLSIPGFIIGWQSARQPQRGALGLLFILITSTLPLALVQGFITGSYFFPRNYLYLLPLVALVSGIAFAALLRWGISALTSMSAAQHPNGALRAAAPLLLVIMGAAGFVTMPTLNYHLDVIDEAIVAVEKHASAGDYLIAGCCIDQSVYYYETKGGDYALFTASPATKQLVVMPSYPHELEQVVKNFGLEAILPSCRAAEWDMFEVRLCPYEYPSEAQ